MGVGKGNGRGGRRPGAGKPKGRKHDVTLVKEAAQRAYLAEEALAATHVLEQARRIAFSDIRRLHDAKGHLKLIHDLTEAEAACIAGVEIVMKNATAGDGHVDRVLKVKVLDKVRALELLMKHFRLLVDTRVDEGAVDWDKRVAQLKAARKRVAS